MDKRTLAAYAIGCQPDELLSFSVLSEHSVKAVGPDGKVYLLTHGDLERAALQIPPDELPVFVEAIPVKKSPRSPRLSGKNSGGER